MKNSYPIKIALVTTFYPPYNFGGDGIYVQRMAIALAELGHDVTVIHDINAYKMLAPRHAKHPKAVIDDRIKVVGIESGFGAVSSFITQQFGAPLVTRGRLKNALSDDFDVIHYHNVSLIGGPAILSYGDAIKLYTAHEHWLVCPSHILWRHNREICDSRECFKCQLVHKRPPQMWRYFANPDKHYEQVDAFIALSQASADNHKKFGFVPDMRVMPSFIPDAVTESNLPHPNNGQPFAFFAGRLEVIKGLQDVIPQFTDEAPLDLLIAGDGQYLPKLTALAADSKRVKFLGRLAADELGSYYENATAVITPSRCYEVFPLVVLEAFRAGTPILARDLGAYREIVEETGAGILFDSPTEIIPALTQLINNPGLQSKFGQKGRGAYVNRWSKKPALKAYFELIEEIAQKKSAASVAQAASNSINELS